VVKQDAVADLHLVAHEIAVCVRYSPIYAMCTSETWTYSHA
jgi:hypothetical protein